jgi:hypothetical protein
MINKLKLIFINNPYFSYGILNEDYRQDQTTKYIKLFNMCQIQILKHIYKAKIKLKDDTLYVLLDKDYIINMTRDDLYFIQSINNDLFKEKQYEKLKKYFNPSLISLIRNENISFPISYPTTNYDFYKCEDFEMINWYVYYNYINSKYEEKFKNCPISLDLLNKNIFDFSSLIFELKMTFNRLRPFQSAFVENINIKTYISYAGQTPALPSGHSLQGFLFGAFIYLYFVKYYESLDKNQLDEEINLLVDVSKETGDRRVMAGVHYPSDVIASWIVFCCIIDHLKIKSIIKPYYYLLKTKLNEFISSY